MLLNSFLPQNLQGKLLQSGAFLELVCWFLRIRDSPYWIPEPIRSGSSSPVSILAKIVFEHFKKASSTLSPVLALVSRNIKSFSCANLLASRKVTSLSSSKSFLLPTRRIMIAGLAKVRASVNQLVRALNVSRDEIS